MNGYHRKYLAGSVILCCLLLLAPGRAGAEVTSVTIDSSRPYEGADGYVYVEATMHGTIAREDGSAGEYSVPLILKYPADGGNGVGVVDWVTSAQLQNMDWIEDEFLVRQVLLTTAGSYLFEAGFTYVAVQWGRSITEIFGPTPPDDGRPYNHLAYGTIERGPDAFEILRDAARFLKDPTTIEGGSRPQPVEAVLSAGYSQTGALQMAFLSQGENLIGGELVYDGHLISKMGFICPQLDDVPPDFGMIPVPCTANPNGDGSRVIHVAAQGDLEFMFMAARTRFEGDPDWRQYEIAGVAHIPPSIIEIGGDQNPIESAPVIRAALRNLSLWVTQRVPPPPSRFLAGSIDDEGNLQTHLDGDGNALGGLRLPHMTQTIDGSPAGAPLGTYAGLDPSGEPPYGIFGGRFIPFEEEELRDRYPEHDVYVSRVARAADRLLNEGYIIDSDRDAYVSDATLSSIGR
jgi:hypothetical protein